MNKRTLGVLIQLIGLALWIFLPATLVPWKGLPGIVLIIVGGIIFRQGRKEKIDKEGKPKKSGLEVLVSTTIILICVFIIGLLLVIAIPNFIKGHKESRQQRLQRETQNTQSIPGGKR